MSAMAHINAFYLLNYRRWYFPRKATICGLCNWTELCFSTWFSLTSREVTYASNKFTVSLFIVTCFYWIMSKNGLEVLFIFSYLQTFRFWVVAFKRFVKSPYKIILFSYCNCYNYHQYCLNVPSSVSDL